MISVLICIFCGWMAYTLKNRTVSEYFYLFFDFHPSTANEFIEFQLISRSKHSKWIKTKPISANKFTMQESKVTQWMKLKLTKKEEGFSIDNRSRGEMMRVEMMRNSMETPLNKRSLAKLPEGVGWPVGKWERKRFCWDWGSLVGAEKCWLQRLWFCGKGGGEKGVAGEAWRSGSLGCVEGEGDGACRAISKPIGLLETRALPREW